MPAFRRRRSPEPPGEQGFVLIAAIWLLILAGSITAILMLRSLSSATLAADQAETLERRLALESAIETVLADRFFNGFRSLWWLTPSEGVVAIGDRQVNVRISSESGRLDINQADPALIDAALRGFQVEPAERARIVARLQALRVAKRPIASFASLSALLYGAGGGAICLEDHLTISSGLAEPRADQLSPELARALGRAGGGSGPVRPTSPEPGAALRLRASEADGAPLTAIVRVSGLIDQPVAISAWGVASSCR